MTRATRHMLAAAAACAAAFAVILGLAYGVGPVEWVDGNAMNGFVPLRDSHAADAANAIARICDPGPYSLIVLLVVAYAFVRRGARRAAAVALLLVGANVTSQVLKPLLAHRRDLSEWPAVHQPGDAAFPSGHATAAMALAFAAVMVVPRAYRPLVAVLGGLFALTVSISIVILNWHYPSDIVGGELVASFWCLIAMAALRWSEARWPEQGSMRRAAREAMVVPSPRVLVGAVVVVLAVGATQAGRIVSFVDHHTTAVVVAVGIAASAAALLAGVTALAARR